jgi:anti-sigma B factor antagonist
VSSGEVHPTYISVSSDDDVSIVGFTLALLTDEENVEQLGRELFVLVDIIGCRKIVLNMAGVRYMTSSVLGKLISMHRKLHRSEGRLVICGIGKELNEIMSKSRLDQYFHLAVDVPEAVSIMGGS